MLSFFLLLGEDTEIVKRSHRLAMVFLSPFLFDGSVRRLYPKKLEKQPRLSLLRSRIVIPKNDRACMCTSVNARNIAAYGPLVEGANARNISQRDHELKEPMLETYGPRVSMLEIYRRSKCRCVSLSIMLEHSIVNWFTGRRSPLWSLAKLCK